MNKKPLISIGILNYNGLGYLKRVIDPILKLDYPNFEVVISDNASTDESINFLENLGDKRIRIIKNKENFGYSKGKNICVENCNGEYVLLLDNDILVEDAQFLEKIYTEYINLKDVAFLAPLMFDEGSPKTKYYGIYYSWYGLNIHKVPQLVREIQNHTESIQIGSFHGGSVFFSKTIWQTLGGYDQMQPIMLDDYDIGARASIIGYNTYLFTQGTLVHLGKERDLNKKYFAWKFRYYFSGILITIFKNYNLKDLLLTLPFYLLFSVALLATLVVTKKNIYIIKSFIISYLFFFKNIKAILKERSLIQSKRTIPQDPFLHIKSIFS